MENERIQLMSRKDAAKLLGISLRTFDYCRLSEDFPKAIRISFNTLRWSYHDIKRWIESRVEVDNQPINNDSR